MSSSGIEQPLKIVHQGRIWYLHSASYKSADGTFSFYFYALSREHALLLLEELKSTATLDGTIVGHVKGRGGL